VLRCVSVLSLSCVRRVGKRVLFLFGTVAKKTGRGTDGQKALVQCVAVRFTGMFCCKGRFGWRDLVIH